jgi:hypothetical protein
VEYYRGEEGQVKKAIQNGKRQAAVKVVESKPETAARWDGPMVEHVRRVVSLIEGRRVGTGEILEMLARGLRQHRMVRRRRIDHRIDWLNKNPP